MATAISTPPSRASGAPASERAATAICPGCGKGVDPLRAGHVAILDGAFAYFCNAQCKLERFRGVASTLSPDEIATMEPPPVVIVPTMPTPAPPKTQRNGNGHTNGNGAPVSSPSTPMRA